MRASEGAEATPDAAIFVFFMALCGGMLLMRDCFCIGLLRVREGRLTAR